MLSIYQDKINTKAAKREIDKKVSEYRSSKRSKPTSKKRKNKKVLVYAGKPLKKSKNTFRSALTDTDTDTE